MKKQVVFIHGGGNFDVYDEYIEYLKNSEFDPTKDKERKESRAKMWSRSLGSKLGGGFEIIAPSMPNRDNAKYEEWKIWFEKLFPHLKDNVVLIAHSLGGIFLAKYLSENDFPKKILATYLVAASYHDKSLDYSPEAFVLPKSLEKFEKQGGEIFLYHSEDDTHVSFESIGKYREALPKANAAAFKDRGHFMGEEFPEIIKSIKGLYGA